MVDWWLSRFVEDTVRYKLWHPKDHVSGKWDEAYYSTPVHKRAESHFVGHTHFVDEYIGGRLNHLQIHFTSPQEVGVRLKPEHGITFIAVGRVHQRLPIIGAIAVRQTDLSVCGVINPLSLPFLWPAIGLSSPVCLACL